MRFDDCYSPEVLSRKMKNDFLDLIAERFSRQGRSEGQVTQMITDTLNVSINYFKSYRKDRMNLTLFNFGRWCEKLGWNAEETWNNLEGISKCLEVPAAWKNTIERLIGEAWSLNNQVLSFSAMVNLAISCPVSVDAESQDFLLHTNSGTKRISWEGGAPDFQSLSFEDRFKCEKAWAREHTIQVKSLFFGLVARELGRPLRISKGGHYLEVCGPDNVEQVDFRIPFSCLSRRSGDHD